MAVRSLVAIIVCLLATPSSALPPDAVQPLLIGFSEGFVSDGPDLMMCGQLALLDVDNLQQAVKDLGRGLMHFNATEIEAALREFEHSIDNMPTTEKRCKTVVSDLKSLIHALRQIKGPRDLVHRVVNHLFDDSDKIFGELSAAEKAYKTGWDYMTAGQQLGMSLRRMLIGEGGDAPPPPHPIPGERKTLLAGVAVGFISDNSNFLDCSHAIRTESQDFGTALKDFEQGIRHLNSTDMQAAIKEFEAAVKSAASVKATCATAAKETVKDVEAIAGVLKSRKGPKDIILHSIDNIFGDGETIFGELSAAGRVYKTADYMGSGRQLGMALRRILVGELPAAIAEVSVVV